MGFLVFRQTESKNQFNEETIFSDEAISQQDRASNFDFPDSAENDVIFFGVI